MLADLEKNQHSAAWDVYWGSSNQIGSDATAMGFSASEAIRQIIAIDMASRGFADKKVRSSFPLQGKHQQQ